VILKFVQSVMSTVFTLGSIAVAGGVAYVALTSRDTRSKRASATADEDPLEEARRIMRKYDSR
jgi:hypothetical protein